MPGDRRLVVTENISVNGVIEFMATGSTLPIKATRRSICRERCQLLLARGGVEGPGRVGPSAVSWCHARA
jgi:hypothetical protein